MCPTSTPALRLRQSLLFRSAQLPRSPPLRWPVPARAAGEDARVRVRFVDFAHTFKLDNGRQAHDANFLAGLRAIIARLTAVTRTDTADSLA